MKNVNILSLSFNEKKRESVLDIVKSNLNGTEDIVILPETCVSEKFNEPGDGFLAGISNIAAENKIYILASVYRKTGVETRANSAFLFDRNGEIAFIYDKVYPWIGEFNDELPKVIPGSRAVCAETDFGRVSAAICFDANFPDLWQDIADLDADLVLFSSAYSAGSQLCAHALNHHYMIITATQKPDFAVYDITGTEITYTRCDTFNRPDNILISRARIDTDRVICHFNYNREKVFKMLKENPGRIELEHEWDREEWFVIRSTSADTNARALCREYGIETLRDYQRRARRIIAEKRI